MRTRFFPAWSSAVVLIVCVTSATWGQGVAPPRTDDGRALPVAAPAATAVSAAADRGAIAFRSSCGFCHGVEAGGGATGPTLLTSNFISPDGQALAAFLKVGRPAAGMPPFPQMTAGEIAEVLAFILRKQESVTMPQKAMEPTAILVGDAAAGKAYFEGAGRCTTCHSATGNLRGIGARYTPVALQARMVNPRLALDGTKQPPSPRVTVTLSKGEVIEGDLVQVNDFFVTLTTANGVRRTVARDNDQPKVVIQDPTDFHRQLLLTWKDADMHNLTAYLATLK